MKLNNFGYLVKEGFRGIFHRGLASFAAVCVTVACLLIVGSFSVLMYNVGIMVEELNKTNEILVYIDSELPEADARSVGTQINRIENVQNSVFVTREEALENFVADHQEDQAFSGVDAADLRHRYVVTLMDNTKMADTVAAIEGIAGVAKINAAYELAEGFTTIQSIVRIASYAVIIALLCVSLLIISNTIKIIMVARKDEIGIMKMVGATDGFIRFPFLVEGFVIGVLSAGIAFGLQWLLYDVLSARLAVVDTLKLFTFVPFERLLGPMIATFSLAGIFVGVVGSLTSVRKFMDV